MQLTTGKKTSLGPVRAFYVFSRRLTRLAASAAYLIGTDRPQGASCTRLHPSVLQGDYTPDPRRKLIIHRDDGQIVPINASARAAANIVKDAVLKVYPDTPHGLAVTHRHEPNAALFRLH